MSEEKQYWSTKELSDAAGISRQYVVRLLNTGKIKGQKVGNYWVIKNVEARRWLLEREQVQG